MRKTKELRNSLGQVGDCLAVSSLGRERVPKREADGLPHRQGSDVPVLFREVDCFSGMVALEVCGRDIGIFQVTRHSEGGLVGNRSKESRATTSRSTKDEQHLTGLDNTGEVGKNGSSRGTEGIGEDAREDVLLDEAPLVGSECVEDGARQGLCVNFGSGLGRHGEILEREADLLGGLLALGRLAVEENADRLEGLRLDRLWA